MRRLILPAVLLATALAGNPLSALPAQAAATSQTLTIHNGTDTFVDVNPCTGDPATITITFNAVMHLTFLESGAVHGTETQTGTFQLVPIDSSLPSFTGRFTEWDGFNANSRNFSATFTFHIIGKGSDGSTLRFHEVAHFSVSASGMTVEFDRPRCG